MDDCLFCKMVRGEINCFKMYEDEDFIVILDRYPTKLGHLLVIPKEHFDNIFELEEKIAAKIFPVVVKFSKALEKALDIQGLNILQNNYEYAGQSVEHFHIHIIPRYTDDKVVFSWESINPDHHEFDEMIERLEKYIK